MPAFFSGTEFSSTGPEGRHIKAQCFSTGKTANCPESRSRGAAKGRNMNIAMCRPFARIRAPGLGSLMIAFPPLKRWALIYRPCRGRVFCGYGVTSLSDVWQCRAGHPDRRIRCHSWGVPLAHRGFLLLTVTTAYCRKGRPFIMLGRPLSFALESEGRRMRPFDFTQGRHAGLFFRGGVFLDRPGGPTYQSPVLQHWENRELS